MTRKAVSSKYDGIARKIIEAVELFQPINTVDIIQLLDIGSNHAFAIGAIHTLSELGMITRDDNTGMYWHTPYNAKFTLQD